jgi:hypothetical protein
MKENNDPTLNANITLDDSERVRQVNHVEQPWESTEQSPVMAAVDYLRRMTGVLSVSETELENPLQKVSFVDPKASGVEYRLGGETQLFDSSTIIFNQTYLNTPVWRAAITLTIKHNPNRVVLVEDTSEEGMNATLPTDEKIEEHRRLFAMAAAEQRLRVLGLEDQAMGAGLAEDDAQPRTAGFVRRMLGRDMVNMAEDSPGSQAPDDAQAIRGRFFVYQYDTDKRVPPLRIAIAIPETLGEAGPAPDVQTHRDLPVLSLPRVDPSIADGDWRVVSEVTFTLTTPEFGTLTWRALVDVEKDSVLLLEPLVSGLDGFVFHRDPISSSGNANNSPNRNNAVLNPLRNSVELANLSAPANGVQSLRGRFAVVFDVNEPRIAPPTVPAGSRFDFNVRTNDFAAVNAYYHTDRFFALVESLGFPIPSYFNNTTFPVRVDHRDNMQAVGDTINAWCVGNGMGGIGYAGYALNDLNDTANPIGRACDSRVHLHELGGHGILYEHVDHPNFGFAHSAGDSLSAILHDPDSRAPDRFRYAPWNPQNTRRFDRSPTDGWAWGGTRDDRGYESEQILCTTLFRVYRAIGGDSADRNQKRFASRMVLYLILRAVSTLTPATNPQNALGFANALMAVDLLNWTTEGIFGGAYNKVIRWSFEQQGLFQGPGAPTPVKKPGKPPAVDVFIEDGRKGEYQYQANYSRNTSIWNRRSPDGGTTHQEPLVGVPNFAYVRIKNRGTTPAQNVRVRGFHHKPDGATVWPTDFNPLTTAELVAGTLAPGGQEEKVVGPFKWVPALDALGHDSLMFVVSATGDSSNIDNFGPSESIPEWRLVPNDNNIGLRNVSPVPAESAPQPSGLPTGTPAPAGPTSSSTSRADELLKGLGLSGLRAKNVRVKDVTLQIELEADGATSGAATGTVVESSASPSGASAPIEDDENLAIAEAAADADWGIRRHAAIATAAAERLQTQKARDELARIFDESGEGSLGAAARWADLIKRSDRPTDPATERFLGDPRNRKHGTWHYVNLPLGLDGYDLQLHPEFARPDDIVQTILLAIESLRAPGPRARFEEITALRWLTHLIGDLHQPIHIGCGFIASRKTSQAHLVFSPDDAIGLSSDRGGGDLRLPTGDSLHGYWDSVLGPNTVPGAINAETDDALVQELIKAPAPPAFAEDLDIAGRIVAWANESLKAARDAYRGLEITEYSPHDNGDYKVKWEGEQSYKQRCAPIVSARMSAAASNLASLLDAIWT